MKLYFNVIDENKFLGKFSKSKVTDMENEIAIHDYKITNIYVGKYNDKSAVICRGLYEELNAFYDAL